MYSREVKNQVQKRSENVGKTRDFDREERDNLVGFFELAITVAKRHPELWSKIISQEEENYD